MKRSVLFFLVFAMVFSAFPAMASNSTDIGLAAQLNYQANAEDDGSFDSDTALKAAGVGVVVVGVVYLGRRLRRRSRLKSLYSQALGYESQGEWGLAVETYEDILSIKSDYEDVDRRLAQARANAEEKYVGLGDEARDKELFEEARGLLSISNEI